METEYLSVTEYAAKVGRDVSRIRRMLSEGKLPGRKIGSQWVVPADAELPPRRPRQVRQIRKLAQAKGRRITPSLPGGIRGVFLSG